jgi:hypothetical protein
MTALLLIQQMKSQLPSRRALSTVQIKWLTRSPMQPITTAASLCQLYHWLPLRYCRGKLGQNPVATPLLMEGKGRPATLVARTTRFRVPMTTQVQQTTSVAPLLKAFVSLPSGRCMYTVGRTLIPHRNGSTSPRRKKGRQIIPLSSKSGRSCLW